jgi:hypothetical protein
VAAGQGRPAPGRPTRSGRNWTRSNRSPAEEERAAAISAAAAAAAAARVAARGRTVLQDAAGLTGDTHMVVPESPPSRWSPRWGMVVLGSLVALAGLALLATWAVRRGSDDGSGSADRPSVEAASDTSAGTGVSAGDRSPVGTGDSTPAGSGPSTPAAPSTTLSSAPSSSTSVAAPVATGAVTVPAGWVTYTDPTTGYRIAHPPDWTVRAVDDVRVDFVDPATGAYMRVDWVRPPGPSAVEAWRSFAPRFAADNPGYQEIRIEPTTFRGLEAAVWEFRYGEGGRLHAVDLGMISGRYGFALNFQAPEAQWNALQPVRRGFENSFQPAS